MNGSEKLLKVVKVRISSAIALAFVVTPFAVLTTEPCAAPPEPGHRPLPDQHDQAHALRRRPDRPSVAVPADPAGNAQHSRLCRRHGTRVRVTPTSVSAQSSAADIPSCSRCSLQTPERTTLPTVLSTRRFRSASTRSVRASPAASSAAPWSVPSLHVFQACACLLICLFPF
jgi:hypothetical protein